MCCMRFINNESDFFAKVEANHVAGAPSTLQSRKLVSTSGPPLPTLRSRVKLSSRAGSGSSFFTRAPGRAGGGGGSLMSSPSTSMAKLPSPSSLPGHSQTDKAQWPDRDGSEPGECMWGYVGGHLRPLSLGPRAELAFVQPCFVRTKLSTQHVFKPKEVCREMGLN